MASPKQCTHKDITLRVTAGDPDGPLNAPYASRTTCNRPACIQAAEDWARRVTGRPATHRPYPPSETTQGGTTERATTGATSHADSPADAGTSRHPREGGQAVTGASSGSGVPKSWTIAQIEHALEENPQLRRENARLENELEELREDHEEQGEELDAERARTIESGAIVAREAVAALTDWHDRTHGLVHLTMCTQEPCSGLDQEFRRIPAGHRI